MRPDTKFAWLPKCCHEMCCGVWLPDGVVWLRRVRVVKTLWGDVIYVRI